jgi:hypothetical protein
MSSIVTDQSRSKVVLIGLAHVLLAVLGIYNLVSLAIYFVDAWRSLHLQGIGHLYLTVAALLCCWWLGLAIAICFIGNSFMPKAAEKITLKAAVMPLVGVALSLIFPSLMVTGWLVVVVWIRAFF